MKNKPKIIKRSLINLKTTWTATEILKDKDNPQNGEKIAVNKDTHNKFIYKKYSQFVQFNINNTNNPRKICA